ncbi:MAG: SurA N-terminal domain-containing protein [Erythrobacter sp.]
MISFFRRFFQSKIGLAITLAFLGLIGLAFASSDVANNATFGGVTGNDRVAVVGDDRIDTSELNQLMQSALQQEAQERPGLTMAAFHAEGGFEDVLTQLIDRYSISGYARKYGLRAGDNLINSEILTFPAFRGASGVFDQAVYQNVLRNQGLSDAALRQDIADGMLAQQMLISALVSPQMPESIARRYTALLRERRIGSIALVPSALFAPEGDPSDEQIQEFFDENRAGYVQPERRILRFAGIDVRNITDRTEPTASEIAAKFEEDAELYAALETRSITSFFVPTEEAAIAIRESVNAGTSLEQAAQSAGFAVSSAEDQSEEALASLTSSAVAEAVFAANRGSVAQPARSALGWYVARVDGVSNRPARTLAQATPDITTQLRIEIQTAALADLSARIEEQVDDGVSLAEVAEEFDLTLQTTPELLANGRVFNDDERGVPEVLLPALGTAFEMDESEPQLTVLVAGQQFLVFEVQEIAQSAAPPIAEIRDRLEFDWRLAEGAKAAREAADRIMERADGEVALAQALQGEDADLPPIENINLTRTELLSQQNQRVAAPLALLFSIAQGTTKRLEAPNNLGWYIIDLDEISIDEIADDDPLFIATKTQLGPAISSEYASQLTSAMRADLGIERNEDAIDAVRRQLLGEI